MAPSLAFGLGTRRSFTPLNVYGAICKWTQKSKIDLEETAAVVMERLQPGADYVQGPVKATVVVVDGMELKAGNNGIILRPPAIPKLLEIATLQGTLTHEQHHQVRTCLKTLAKLLADCDERIAFDNGLAMQQERHTANFHGLAHVLAETNQENRNK